MVRMTYMTQRALARIAGERGACESLDPAASWKKEHQQPGALSAHVPDVGGEVSDRAQVDRTPAPPLKPSRLTARRPRQAGRRPEANERSTPPKLRIAPRSAGWQDAQSNRGGAAFTGRGGVTHSPWLAGSPRAGAAFRMPTGNSGVWWWNEILVWTQDVVSRTVPIRSE